MRTTQKLLVLFTVAVMALSACSTLRTASDYDKKVSFTNYKTYNFYDKGITRLKLNDLDKRRMLSAIDAEMTTKGFTKAENPDLLVNLVVVARERVDAYGSGFYGPGWGWGWGWRSPFWSGGANYIDQYMEGTIIIDFLDPKTKTLVWHGRGSGFNLDNFRKREERMNTGVKEILSQYPPNASTNN